MLIKFLMPVLLVAFAHAVDKAPAKKPPPPDHRPVPHELKCLKDGIMVTVERKPLPYIELGDLRLLDQNCILKLNKEGNFVIKYDFKGCNTKAVTTPTHIIYQNEVVGKFVPKSAISHRIKDVRVKLQCSYPRVKKLTSDAIEPNQDKFRAASRADGKFKFSIKMYGNNKFEKEFKYPKELHLRRPVFVELSVLSEANQLAILAQNCYATPTEHGSKIKHDLIKNSCPAADKTVKFLKSPKESVQRFRFQTFVFNKKQKYVFIHCQVIACQGGKKGSVCAKGCQNKKLGKREFDESSHLKSFKLTQGPFAIKDAEPLLDERFEQDRQVRDEAANIPM